MNDKELLIAIANLVMDSQLRPAQIITKIIYLLAGAGYLKPRRGQ